MKNSSQLHQETNAIQYDFLLVDIKMGGTFLDLAQTTQNEETRTRNLHNAAKAYATVLRLRSRVTMTQEQSAALDAEMDAVKGRIESLDPSGQHTSEGLVS